MTKVRRLVVALGTCVVPLLANGQTNAEVASFTTEYFHALSRGEASDIVASSYEPLLERMGPDPTSTLVAILDSMRAHGTMPYDFSINQITSFEGTDGHKVFLIELTTVTESFPNPIQQTKLWAAIPNNSGDLKMLSLDCISVPWIESAAHGFSDSTLAARLVKQGLIRQY